MTGISILLVLLGTLALGGCTAEENAQLGDLGSRLQGAGAALRDNPPPPMPPPPPLPVMAPCAIGLHDLTGNFLLAAKHRRRCSVLTINDRKLAAFDRRHDDGGKLRPVEVLGYLIDVSCAPPTDFTLISYVDDKFVRLYPFQKGRGPG